MENLNQEALRTRIAERNARLAQVAGELKTELFGIDAVIDRVIDSLRAWYVLPEIINRPVIICLWGLTGTGKTQLTRSLAQKLGFYDRFVEVQMDGFANGSGSGSRATSISGMLLDSGIAEGTPGILVLDEFQRYRTLNKQGEEERVSRYQDVWALLSDGRLPPSLSFVSELEYSLADTQFDIQRRDAADAKESAPRRFRLYPSDAQTLKQNLKLTEPLTEIMAWPLEEVQARLLQFRERQASWETDYSKLLIFVSGNLDEMYQHMATKVEDCDTDADIFHEVSKRLSVIHVKQALNKRFKPEQVARLGNNHVIYPSLDRATYRKLIASTCQRYLDDMAASSGLSFTVSEALQEEIYANGVFPAQGTRPLFSSIHALLSAPLVTATLWAMEQGATPQDQIALSVNDSRIHLTVAFGSHSTLLPVNFELNRLKQRNNLDFRALLAVHEAGHGLLYALLFGQPPQEIKINAASFDGGYNSYGSLRAESRQNSLDHICVGLGGRAAEAMVFGEDACTTGAAQDIKQATASAAAFVRHHAFAGRFSRTDVTQDSDDGLNTDVAATNQAMEALLAQQYARAQALLRQHCADFLHVVRELTQHGEVSKHKLAQWLGLRVSSEPDVLEPYAAHLAAFESQMRLLGQLGEEVATRGLPLPALAA